jgi:transposase InsO family protein
MVVLHNEVLACYSERGCRWRASWLTTARSSAEARGPPYRIYLELNYIEVHDSKVGRLQTNSSVERFNRTVQDEFFREGFRWELYESVEVLQQDLDG